MHLMNILDIGIRYFWGIGLAQGKLSLALMEGFSNKENRYGSVLSVPSLS